MLAAVSPLGAQTVALAAARGRVLAAPVIAGRSQPPFAASAMDGYALRAADTPGRLRIVGESAAGHAFARALAPGEAVRISTGAPVPLGADAVLAQEDARVEGDGLDADVVIFGRHVRAEGVDFAVGAELLRAGRRLDAIALGVAAAAGSATVQVRQRPRLSILCAGDEIVAPGGAPRADQVFESCSYAIAGLAETWGAAVSRCDLLPDDPVRIERAAARALGDSDLVVFIGSASVGPHDHAKPVFEKLGARILVRKVDMRPGKPTWFATTPGAPVLGLPGNPASAVVAAILFLRPLLERFEGGKSAIVVKYALLAAPLAANGAREAYLRARVDTDDRGQRRVRAAKEQDSSLLTVLAASNALIIRHAHAPPVAAGEAVIVLELAD
jgi:molybdopterin molybdotransferase